MIKKGTLTFCILLIAVICVSQAAFSAAPIHVVLDGKTLRFDVEPETIEFRTMVPMRVIFEALDAFIEWDGDTMTITAYREEKVIVTTIGSKTMTVDGKPTEMDVAPILKDSRTLVPVRFISEAFGCEVKWDELAGTVYIKSPPESAAGGGYDNGFTIEPLENENSGDHYESYEDFYSP